MIFFNRFIFLVLLFYFSTSIAQIKKTDFTSGYLKCGKAMVYYESKGSGMPLILIHGGGMDRRMWDGQFDEFSMKYRVIRYDIRNHGRTTAESGKFFFHEELKALMDSLNIKKAVIMGLSMGGSIAIDFTITNPQRVIALITVSSIISGFEIKDKEVVENDAEMRKASTGGSFNTVVELVLRSWVDGPYRSPAQVNAEVRNKAKELISSTYSKWNPLVVAEDINPPASKRLKEIKVPTLAIVANLDMPSINKIADLITKDATDSRKIMVMGSAHLINMEKREEFNAVVLNFLSKLKY
jgi:3-oxoadipate enol-lactonase